MTDSTGNPSKNRDDARFDRRGGPRGRHQRNHDKGGAGERGSRSNKGRNGQRSSGKRQFRGGEDQPRRKDGGDATPKHNPADLRSANRPDRGRSPNIDDDVTGRELDKSVQRELGTLDEQNRTWVQKHLVMAGRLLEEDPELAFEHALAASRRGGRLGVVREAAGMTAYAAGKYTEALREFRTYRRITGDDAHLPEMVDSERALGRTAKALQLVQETQLDRLPTISRVELAMVVAGIHLENDDAKAAIAALEIPQLNPRRGFSYSPRLFRAYAQALEAAGRTDDSRKWSNLAARAERALGLHVEPEPEIFDMSEDEDTSQPKRARDVVPPAGSEQQTSGDGREE